MSLFTNYRFLLASEKTTKWILESQLKKVDKRIEQLEKLIAAQPEQQELFPKEK